ncbi:MAG: tRNA (N6-isopentenyl adenosine(37)-C2)-methylthiotransferase MiaB [Bdellovibrionales bacterium]|nr:tRNA (N6-isopentenyl adenosine(37)-C2)-methylthiotransferase MiaB [Bdellovibrionales bacterium]
MNLKNPKIKRPGETEGESKRFFISTYGCQMNVNDTDRMACLLEMSGYAPIPRPEMADLILINSCSIREKPVHKVRSEAGRYRKLKMNNPKLKIGVAGCVAQQERGRLLKDIPFIDFVLGTDAIDELPSLLASLEEKGAKQISVRQTPKEPYHIQTLIKNPKVSAFVNISKGCDNFCSFCVVPFTRGRERSRPLQHIVEDLRALYQRGVREVTLLGQNVNSYRSECGADFGRLLEALAVQTDIQRIRFTTSHPKDFNKELVEIMQDHRDKIMDFIHLPVQSGSTEVLRRMNRGYSREEYIEKALMILEKMPESVLSTDIIVGFPGETEEEFEETMSLLDEVPYESLFSFKYSPRPFTKAAFYENQLPESEKSRRLYALQEKHEKIAFSLARKYKGQVLSVLAEKRDKKSGLFMGRSTHNKLVYFEGVEEDLGCILPIQIQRTFPLTFYGEKVS